jgi:hypothetical protein
MYTGVLLRRVAMFYVYVYYDPRPLKLNQPVYVGKGTGDRDISHWSRGSHNKPFQDFISHLKQRGLVAASQRVFETENEGEAFAKEIELIELYGRRDIKTGTLFNRTDGGEGASGAVRTEKEKKLTGKFSKEHWQKPEYRAKVIAAQIVAQNTPEALSTKSQNSKALWQQQPDKMAAGIKAARNTKESKAKTSAQAKAQWADPEYAAKQTANNQEIANRVEVKAAKAAAAKALWADPVWKAKMMAARNLKKSNKLLAP